MILPFPRETHPELESRRHNMDDDVEKTRQQNRQMVFDELRRLDGNGQSRVEHEGITPLVFSNHKEPTTAELCVGNLQKLQENARQRFEIFDEGSGIITARFKTGAGEYKPPQGFLCLAEKQGTQGLLRKWRQFVLLTRILKYWNMSIIVSEFKKTNRHLSSNSTRNWTFKAWKCHFLNLADLCQEILANVESDEHWVSIREGFLDQILPYQLMDMLKVVKKLSSRGHIREVFYADYNAALKLVVLLNSCVQQCKQFCLNNNINPYSEWAAKAVDRLFKSMRNASVYGLEDICMDSEIQFLQDCMHTGMDPDAPKTAVDEKKYKLAQEAANAAATALLDEVEKEKKEAIDKELKRKASKAAKKKRRNAKSLESLASIHEEVEATNALLDVAPSVQTTASVVDAGSECNEFVNLSDLKSSLIDKNDDAATSVATALQCVVCFKNERSTACVPCGHKCLCNECARNEKIRQCPICRAPIEMRLRVWE